MMTYLNHPRRTIRWENFKQNPKGALALVLSTFFGAGLAPAAPGTMGTLFAVPIVFLTTNWDIPARLALWISITAIGVWAAATFDEVNGTKDNQNTVIDEVAGYGITAWTAAGNPWTLLAAFIAFRFFDVLKPWPVRQVDRWSHTKSGKWWTGFGVMADDVLAGFQGLIVIGVLQWLKILP